MSTRITGGSERGRRLRSSKTAGLRPTSERVRAAIFSMIGSEAVEGARVLDLYAGTGALGIEALSRGGSWADFVEAHAGLCRDIRHSLAELGFTEQSRVLRSKVEKSIDTLEGGYDLVLIDPPYDSDPWERLMGRLENERLLNENALVVVEHRHDSRLADEYGQLARRTDRRHGDTSISIYQAGGAVG